MADAAVGIGSIKGIKIELHWTFILLLIFVSFLGVYDVLLIIVLFLFVLLHELAHSFTSKRLGVKVKRIVLYPFGGGSIIDNEALSAQKELKISLAGPLASIGLGILTLIISLLIPKGSISTDFYMLFELNMLLGIFNLLPWIPLDGGRALRAYLQRKMGFLEATEKAVKLGRIITIAYLAISTAYIILSYTSIADMELLIIFNFAFTLLIYGGAESELLSARIKKHLQNIRVSYAMTRRFDIISSSVKIEQLRKMFYKKNIYNHIIITRKNGNYAMLSNRMLRSIILKGAEFGASIADVSVKLTAISSNRSLFYTLQDMESEGIDTMCVVKKGRLVGILQRQHAEFVATMYMHNSKKDIKA